MRIQHLIGACVNEKLALEWQTMVETEAVLVQIAYDVEFTDTTRTFILPKTNTCMLDTGPGHWFTRAAPWSKGKIEWSGIVGPFVVASRKAVVPIKKSIIKSYNYIPLVAGIRIYTGRRSPAYIAFLEFSSEPTFIASLTKTFTVYDWGKGHVDFTGLNPNLSYHFRISSFTDEALDTVPTTIKELGTWSELEKMTPLPAMVTRVHGDLANKKADELFVKEMKEKPSRHFASYADYIRFKAMGSKMSGL